MNRNEKFVHFLESLITDENQSLIEAIYEGFETITEANRAEQGMTPQQIMQNREQKRNAPVTPVVGGNSQMTANVNKRGSIAANNSIKKYGAETNIWNSDEANQQGRLNFKQRGDVLNSMNDSGIQAARQSRPISYEVAKNASGANSSYKAELLAKLGLNQQQINGVISIFQD